MNTTASLGAVSTGRLRARGQLEVIPLTGEDAGLQRFALDIGQVDFEPAPGTTPEEYAALKQELEAASGGFSLKAGVLSEQRLHRGATPVAANLLRTLVGLLQYAPRSEGPTLEVDSTGHYVAEYAPGGAQGEVTKRKLRYERVNLAGVERGQKAKQVLPEIANGAVEIRLEGERITSVASRESVKNEMDGKVVLQVDLEATLQLLDAGPSEGVNEAAILAATTTWSTEKPYLGPDEGTRFDSVRTGELSYEQALSKLLEIREATQGDFASGKDGAPLDAATRELRKRQLSEYQRAFAALAAHLRMTPGAVDQAARQFAQGKGATQTILLDALGAAGSPQAQRLLLRMVEDRTLEPRLRGEAASSVARADAPVRELEGVLVGMARDPVLGEFGLFGLGTLARRLREAGETARSQSVDQLLAKELDGASDAAQKRRVLLAISNSGSVALLPKVRPVLAEKDPQLASASVAALRLMPGPEVDHLLSAALGHSVRSVRVQALDAMRARPTSEILVTAVVQLAMAADVSDALRGIQLLEHWQKDSAEVRRALHTIADNASSEKARNAARSALPG